MAARAVLVPGSGFSDAGRVAQTGFTQLASTFQQLGQNKRDRLSKASEIAGKQTELQAHQTSRDVLTDTQKSAEFDTVVNNRYDVLNSMNSEAEDRINTQFASDMNTVYEESKIAENGMAKSTRQADGSISTNPDYSKVEQTREGLLADLNIKREDELNALNKKTIALNKKTMSAFESGEFDKVTNAKSYSNRVYQNAIKQGLSTQQAEILRKQEFERTKEAEITERQKYGLTRIDADEKSRIAEETALAGKTTIQNQQGNKGGVGKLPASSKARVKELSKNLPDTSSKGHLEATGRLDKSLESVDLSSWFGDDFTHKDVSNLNTELRKHDRENYSPDMLNIVLENAVNDKGSWIYDENISGGDAKVKAYKKAVVDEINQVKSNRALISGLNASGGASTATNLTTRSVTGMDNKKAFATNVQGIRDNAEKARRAILKEGKNETAAEMGDRIFGDVKQLINPDDYTTKPKAETAEKPAKPSRDVITKPSAVKTTNSNTAQTKNNADVSKDFKEQSKSMDEVEKKEDTYDRYERELLNDPAKEADIPGDHSKEYNTKEFKALSPEAQKAIKTEYGSTDKVDARNVSNKEAKDVSSKLIQELDSLDFGDNATVAQAKAYNKKKREVFSSWGTRLKTYGRNFLDSFDQKDEAGKQRLRNQVKAGDSVAGATQREIDAYRSNSKPNKAPTTKTTPPEDRDFIPTIYGDVKEGRRRARKDKATSEAIREISRKDFFKETKTNRDDTLVTAMNNGANDKVLRRRMRYLFPYVPKDSLQSLVDELRRSKK